MVYHKAADKDVDAVLKGVVRVEGLDDAAPYVQAVLERVKPEYLVRVCLACVMCVRLACVLVCVGACLSVC